MPDRTILVFGRFGQVAAELRRAPLPEGWSLLSLSRAEADVRDCGRVTEAVQHTAPRFVVNAAAYTAVDQAEVERDAAMLVNRDGAANIAEACAQVGVPLLHISTDYVFDGTKKGAYREEDPVAPINVYGDSKAQGEAEVQARNQNHLILRTSWVYSPFGHNFLRTMIGLAAKPTLDIVADQHGAPTAAVDIAAVLLRLGFSLAERPDPALRGVFHYCGGGTTTWHGFATAIFDALAQRGIAVPKLRAIATADFPARARRPANSTLDCSRIAAIHGILPRPWPQALSRCIDEVITAPSR